MSEKRRPSRVEERVVRRAADQQGVISTTQLHASGADKDWIHKRAAMGWLVPVFRGVWGIGHPPRTRRGWYVAALLAGGERSVLSHTTAAAVHEMAGGSRQLHLTVPRTAHGIEGIRVHRPRTLRPEDIVIVDGLRVTSPVRRSPTVTPRSSSSRSCGGPGCRSRTPRSSCGAGGATSCFASRRWSSRSTAARRTTATAPSSVTPSATPRSSSTSTGPLRFTRRAVKFDQGYVELALRTVLGGAYSTS
jgi:hypothetical protein